MSTRWTWAALTAALLTTTSPAALAGVQVYDFGAGSQWRSSTDPLQGQQWAIGNFAPTDGVAAWAPYGNPATPSLDAAHMMWNCGSDGSACKDSSGQITGGDGPSETYYALAFTLDPGAHVASSLMSLIGDDFFDLVINGQEIMAGTLDQHMSNGQPDPVTINLAPYFHTGRNVMVIRAMDGYLLGNATSCNAGFALVSSNLGDFCTGNRGYQYLYVSGGALTVPEPGMLALLGLGLVCLTPRRGKSGPA